MSKSQKLPHMTINKKKNNSNIVTIKIYQKSWIINHMKKIVKVNKYSHQERNNQNMNIIKRVKYNKTFIIRIIQKVNKKRLNQPYTMNNNKINMIIN